MDNYNLEWRIWAKVVAVVDLILSICTFIVTIIMASLAGFLTDEVLKSDDKVPVDVEVVTWIVWCTVIVMAIMTGIELWAAAMLIKATELGRDTNEAIKFCSSWRTVCIAFLTLTVIGDIMSADYVMVAIHLLIRGGFLFIVNRFTSELRTVVVGSPHQTQNSQKV